MAEKSSIPRLDCFDTSNDCNGMKNTINPHPPSWRKKSVSLSIPASIFFPHHRAHFSIDTLMMHRCHLPAIPSLESLLYTVPYFFNDFLSDSSIRQRKDNGEELPRNQFPRPSHLIICYRSLQNTFP